jgi:hypothetical protein
MTQLSPGQTDNEVNLSHLMGIPTVISPRDGETIRNRHISLETSTDEVPDFWHVWIRSPYDLGDLTGVDAEYVEGYIFGSTDQDNFSFWEIDYWDSDFYIEVTLEPPSQLDLSMDLFFIDDENGASAVHVATSASAGAGGTETIVFEGWNTEWSDGTYIVRIWSENQGESCSRPYQMKIDSLAPDWW